MKPEDRIKNWHLFTDKFGNDYRLHDAVVKRFDHNMDSLTIQINTLYDWEDGKVYDISFRFSNLISVSYEAEIGADYIYGLEVKMDEYYKNLFVFSFDGLCLDIRCFQIEVVSIVESEPFQRGMIQLEDADQTAESYGMLWRS